MPGFRGDGVFVRFDSGIRHRLFIMGALQSVLRLPFVDLVSMVTALTSSALIVAEYCMCAYGFIYTEISCQVRVSLALRVC